MQLSLLNPLDAWLAPPPLARRVAWLGKHAYAHRGLHSSGVPENSPAAFAAAMERGLGIECDVQRSGDGQAMVFHDWELDRLTGESGPLMDRSSAQLANIVLSGGTDGIPSLRKVLDQVGGKVPVLIEVKSKGDRNLAPLCLAVRRVLEGYLGPHAVMSFDPQVSRWFFNHSPMTLRGLVVTEEDDKALPGRFKRHMALWHAKPDFLAYDVRDLPSRFAAAQRKRGIPVLTWTVRDAEHRDRAAQHADAPIAEGAGVV
jgi:glycerophosphoryl diester phosphodiesterase